MQRLLPCCACTIYFFAAFTITCCFGTPYTSASRAPACGIRSSQGINGHADRRMRNAYPARCALISVLPQIAQSCEHPADLRSETYVHTLAATSPCTTTSRAPPALAPGSGFVPAAAANFRCSAAASGCGSSRKVSMPTMRVTRCRRSGRCYRPLGNGHGIHRIS